MDSNQKPHKIVIAPGLEPGTYSLEVSGRIKNSKNYITNILKIEVMQKVKISVVCDIKAIEKKYKL